MHRIPGAVSESGHRDRIFIRKYRVGIFKMSKNTLFYCWLSLILFFLFAPPLLADIDEKEMKQLEKGEVLVSDTTVTGPDGLKQMRGTAVAIIDVPPEQVWKTIMDHDHFEEFMPSVKECKIVEDTGNDRLVSYHLKIAWADITYFLRLHYDPETWHVDCAIDKSRPHAITDTRCTWDLEPLNGGKQTKVNYSVYVDSGRLIPGFVERMLSKRQLPTVLENVRKRAVSGGTWKK
jgi:carbon monoxide dehydrogenase subunit G